MSSFTTSLWNFITFKSTSKRATPSLISNVVDSLPSASLHDRSTYFAPPVRSPQVAFKSKLFLDHPTRYVSFGELIPGLTPPSEIQVQELESIKAEGTIIPINLSENELERRLLQSLACKHAVTPLLSDPTLPSHLASPIEWPMHPFPGRRPSACEVKQVMLEHANSPIEEKNFFIEEAYNRYFRALSEYHLGPQRS
ncbi:hypothetical protein JCM5353_008639 [Sporobolomyces roseus]